MLALTPGFNHNQPPTEFFLGPPEHSEGLQDYQQNPQGASLALDELQETLASSGDALIEAFSGLSAEIEAGRITVEYIDDTNEISMTVNGSTIGHEAFFSILANFESTFSKVRSLTFNDVYLFRREIDILAKAKILRRLRSFNIFGYYPGAYSGRHDLYTELKELKLHVDYQNSMHQGNYFRAIKAAKALESEFPCTETAQLYEDARQKAIETSPEVYSQHMVQARDFHDRGELRKSVNSYKSAAQIILNLFDISALTEEEKREYQMKILVECFYTCYSQAHKLFLEARRLYYEEKHKDCDFKGWDACSLLFDNAEALFTNPLFLDNGQPFDCTKSLHAEALKLRYYFFMDRQWPSAAGEYAKKLVSINADGAKELLEAADYLCFDIYFRNLDFDNGLIAVERIKDSNPDLADELREMIIEESREYCKILLETGELETLKEVLDKTQKFDEEFAREMYEKIPKSHS